ncbi:hypothetical protein EZS27_013649 [termite gut metagenome]|uniref:Uncharacterized protein n=1 Tax=termite gut metagenome TaxID=433724 RepID=A0A5J4RZ50_9ZZZZ
MALFQENEFNLNINPVGAGGCRLQASTTNKVDMITIELYELKNICMDMAELGAANYAKLLYPAKDNVSQREAYRMFDEARVKNWLKRGLLHTVRSGETKKSKILYSYAELLALEKTERMDKIVNNLTC